MIGNGKPFFAKQNYDRNKFKFPQRFPVERNKIFNLETFFWIHLLITRIPQQISPFFGNKGN
jgi:hypothetical protein